MLRIGIIVVLCYALAPGRLHEHRIIGAISGLRYRTNKTDPTVRGCVLFANDERGTTRQPLSLLYGGS